MLGVALPFGLATPTFIIEVSSHVGANQNIIVWDDRIEVRFKCGATVEQKYVE